MQWQHWKSTASWVWKQFSSTLWSNLALHSLIKWNHESFWFHSNGTLWTATRTNARHGRWSYVDEIAFRIAFKKQWIGSRHLIGNIWIYDSTRDHMRDTALITGTPVTKQWHTLVGALTRRWIENIYHTDITFSLITKIVYINIQIRCSCQVLLVKLNNNKIKIIAII